MKIEGIILDWAGTTIDYGCFAPVQAFLDAFEHFGLQPTIEEVRQPMGTLKWDHIQSMLAMPNLERQFKELTRREVTTEDIDALHELFAKKLDQALLQHTELKPDTLAVIEELRKRKIKIGSTTGFNQEMMKVVVKSAAEQGYEPDTFVTPDQVSGYGRPFPYMAFENMKRLELKDVRKVMKVGDTTSDILEGKNAGLLTVGVIEGSSIMGLTLTEYERLSIEQKRERSAAVALTFKQAGADHVVQTLSEIIELVG